MDRIRSIAVLASIFANSLFADEPRNQSGLKNGKRPCASTFVEPPDVVSWEATTTGIDQVSDDGLTTGQGGVRRFTPPARYRPQRLKKGSHN
jgi:hypothetical protein